MSEPNAIPCDDLDAAIEEHKMLGYRLDMIFPADNPRVCVMSRGDERVRLVSGVRSPGFSRPTAEGMPPEGGTPSDWIVGRAGMEYRALSPRFSGPPKGGTPSAAAVHHIRLTTGGEVPDYVHYHKIDFQMIYCKRGRIKVVYEDQGEPFWLETGDCVLQPPEIRHRVLECTAGAEVIEVSMPAEHETWVEHEIALPTGKLNPDRDFRGQRFVRHTAANAEWTEDMILETSQRDTEISIATHEKAYVYFTKTANWGGSQITSENENMYIFCFPLSEIEYLTVLIMK